jgi:hypothetical protein
MGEAEADGELMRTVPVREFTPAGIHSPERTKRPALSKAIAQDR